MLARSALIDGIDVVSANCAHKGECAVICVPHIAVYTGTVNASINLSQGPGENDRLMKMPFWLLQWMSLLTNSV
jgi:hypothetical protein